MSGPLSLRDVQRLRSLASKVLDHGRSATAGPWFVVGPPWNRGAPYIHAGTEDPHAGNLICDAFDRDDDSRDHIDDDANFELIALYRSAAPALAAALLRLLPVPTPQEASSDAEGGAVRVSIALDFASHRDARLWAERMDRHGWPHLAAQVLAGLGDPDPAR